MHYQRLWFVSQVMEDVLSGRAGTLLVTETSRMQFFIIPPASFLKDRALFVWMAPVETVLPVLLQSLSLSVLAKQSHNVPQ